MPIKQNYLINSEAMFAVAWLDVTCLTAKKVAPFPNAVSAAPWLASAAPRFRLCAVAKANWAWTCARGAAALCPTGLDSTSAAVAQCLFPDAVCSCEPPATAAAQESKSVTERGVLRGNEPMRDRPGRLVGRIWGCSAHFENTIA
jgi:hypothetical protein